MEQDSRTHGADWVGPFELAEGDRARAESLVRFLVERLEPCRECTRFDLYLPTELSKYLCQMFAFFPVQGNEPQYWVYIDKHRVHCYPSTSSEDPDKLQIFAITDKADADTAPEIEGLKTFLAPLELMGGGSEEAYICFRLSGMNVDDAIAAAHFCDRVG